MTARQFVDGISTVQLPNVFNPYRDVCDIADHAESPAIRRQNLGCYFDAMVAANVRTLWLGRDLGYRGGRRTGIALTDEFHLEMLISQYHIAGVARATVNDDVKKERTATEVWKLLRAIREPVFLWNVFPFHPFEEGKPLTNRRHTIAEFWACADILIELVDCLKPDAIVVLGADAENALSRLGIGCQKVRHPSYGGQHDFAREIQRIYRDTRSDVLESANAIV